MKYAAVVVMEQLDPSERFLLKSEVAARPLNRSRAKQPRPRASRAAPARQRENRPTSEIHGCDGDTGVSDGDIQNACNSWGSAFHFSFCYQELNGFSPALWA
ncbi:unnamed protein product [Caretta caretta]